LQTEIFPVASGVATEIIFSFANMVAMGEFFSVATEILTEIFLDTSGVATEIIFSVANEVATGEFFGYN
jgi:FtsZ-interacting cell division protein ZipA